MAYNEFSIKKVKENFGLNIVENTALFGHIELNLFQPLIRIT